MAKQYANLLVLSVSQVVQQNLATRYILTYGAHHPSKRLENGAITARLQMIIPAMYTRVSLLFVKSDTFSAYQEFESWMKMQHGTSIKRLHSNHGGEYLSDKFSRHLNHSGTERKLTTHDTPQHNGMAERLNRTLVEHVHTVLHVSRLPKTLWGEALLHVVWVKNRSATRALDGKTPYEMLYGKKPHLGDLPVWGSKCWVLDHSGSKLDDRCKTTNLFGRLCVWVCGRDRLDPGGS